MTVDLVHGGFITLFWLTIFRLIAYHWPDSLIGKMFIFAN